MQKGSAPALAHGLSEAFCTRGPQAVKGTRPNKEQGYFSVRLQGYLKDLEREDFPDEERAVVSKVALIEHRDARFFVPLLPRLFAKETGGATQQIGIRPVRCGQNEAVHPQ